MATGGGAYKYYDKLKEALGVNVLREDEMECLIIGMYSRSLGLQVRKLTILLSGRLGLVYHGNPT
jgi:hypothetical protein